MEKKRQYSNIECEIAFFLSQNKGHRVATFPLAITISSPTHIDENSNMNRQAIITGLMEQDPQEGGRHDLFEESLENDSFQKSKS